MVRLVKCVLVSWLIVSFPSYFTSLILWRENNGALGYIGLLAIILLARYFWRHDYFTGEEREQDPPLIHPPM